MSDKNIKKSVDEIRNLLEFQFEISWQLLEIHLTELDDSECLWRPSSRGLHVVNNSGTWEADWPDSEAYDIGPSSIAWITWHIIFWWSMVFDYSIGDGILEHEDVYWPGDMVNVRKKIIQLRDEWRTVLKTLPEEGLISCERTKWPFEDKPFYELAAWLNIELMKNAAEIGYCRFLYASQNTSSIKE